MADGANTLLVGILGVAGCAALYFALKAFFPSLASFLLVSLGVIAALIVVLVLFVMFLALRKPKDAKNGEKALSSGEMDGLVSQSRTNIMEVRRFSMRVKNPEVRSLSEGICGSANKIIRTLKEHPENVSQVKQFFNYYLPTLASILSKYVRLEESGMPDKGMTEQTISFLQNITGAMDKQYENLFEDDKFNLEVEMEVLTAACKRDGLLVGEEFVLHDGNREIRLTL